MNHIYAINTLATVMASIVLAKSTHPWATLFVALFAFIILYLNISYCYHYDTDMEEVCRKLDKAKQEILREVFDANDNQVDVLKRSIEAMETFNNEINHKINTIHTIGIEEEGTHLSDYPILTASLETMTLDQMKARVPKIDQCDVMLTKNDWIKCMLECMARKTLDGLFNGESIWKEWNRLPISVNNILNANAEEAGGEFLHLLSTYNKA